MLDPKAAADVISAGIESGADFVDVFVEKHIMSTLSYSDQKVKDIKSGTDFGVGIRVIFGTQVLYGYANQKEREELLRIVSALCANHKRQTVNSAQFSELSGLKSVSEWSKAKYGLDHPYDLEKKIAYLSQIDKSARKTSLISQVDSNVIERLQEIEIFNSEGLHTSANRNYTRLATSVIATDGGEQARAFDGPGGMSGWEITESINPEQLAETLAKRAVTVLHADPCPAGQMPVILDNGFGGVIFHEACGHLLETTSVEKKASVFHDKMGEMIANEAVSAVDDGTIAGMWGSIAIDDEGMKTQKTQLIKDGKLVSFLVDRVGSLKTGYARTGSARRQNYKFAPASRMRNTYIEPGPYELEDMLSTIDNGLYAKVMGGGSVTPGTGDFNFAVEEAYLIENGKLGKAVKGATLIGSGPEALKNISMTGKNFALAPGMCGSVSGAVPVTVGQPALKVDQILVGGQS